MKMQRFEAENNHKAYMLVHKALGPDALIFSTQKTDKGIEIMAGYEGDDEDEPDLKPTDDNVKIEKFVQKNTLSPNMDIMETLNNHLARIDEKISQFNSGYNKNPAHEVLYFDDQVITYNEIVNAFIKMNYSGVFCKNMLDKPIRKYIYKKLNPENIVEKILADIICVRPSEFSNKRKIMALIGPTGSGKTLTIAKLACRYAKKFGNESIGLITTDYNDISGINQLLHFSKQLNIQIEYANDNAELQDQLRQMEDKRLVLIDTYGVRHKDVVKQQSLYHLFDRLHHKVQFYLTLACNVQESILKSTVDDFIKFPMFGCVLTKQDEAPNLASTTAACYTYQLPISYITNHQNIHEGLILPDKQQLVNDLIRK